MFNCLIGANASGKSNFVSIFKFLRDICKSGLDNAISLQGGIEYITNINGQSNPLKVKIHLSIEGSMDFALGKMPGNAINLKEIIYSFELLFFAEKFGLSYKIKEERMETLADFKEILPRKRIKRIIGEVKIKSCLNDSKLEFTATPKELNITLADIFPLINLERELQETSDKQKELRLIPAIQPVQVAYI